jgi:hypothetical protein
MLSDFSLFEGHLHLRHNLKYDSVEFDATNCSCAIDVACLIEDHASPGVTSVNATSFKAINHALCPVTIWLWHQFKDCTLVMMGAAIQGSAIKIRSLR